MEDFLKPVLQFFTEATANSALNVIGTLAMFFIGLFAIRWVMRLLDAALEKSKLDKGIITFVSSFASIGLKVMLVVMAAIQLGVPSASFVTLMGSAGLAIGLALQGSLSNLAGGFMILLYHPFRVGHFIQAGADSGVVKEIGIFYTTLETPDRKTVVLPNGNLSKPNRNEFLAALMISGFRNYPGMPSAMFATDSPNQKCDVKPPRREFVYRVMLARNRVIPGRIVVTVTINRAMQ